MKQKKKYENPVVEIYKGRPIHQSNPVMLKFGPAIFKHILDEVERTGLSIYKVLAYSSKPCERCKDVMVIAFDKNGIEQKVKRGIMSKTIPQDNGVNILVQSKNKNAEGTIPCNPNT